MYLQMGGTGYIQCPSITMTTFEIDMVYQSKGTTEYIFDGRTGLSDAIVYNGTYKSGLGKFTGTDGTTYVNGSPVLSSNDITRDVRLLLKAVTNTVFSDNVTFFAKNDLTSSGKGLIYSIKIYNGTTLKAHYDMNTGTVQDQSGNGNHATLVGGTWVNEGGTTTPIDSGTITLSSSTNLTSSGSKITNAQTALQSISDLSITGAKVSTGESNLSIQTTLQGEGSRIRGNESILQSLSNLSASGSKIMNGESQLNAITSLIAEGEILSLDISVNLSASSSLQATGTKVSTGQSTLSANGQLLSTGTVVYNGESILVADTNLTAILGEGLIGNITLEGSRQLNIYLIGNRELNITLQGNRQLHVTLQGSV